MPFRRALLKAPLAKLRLICPGLACCICYLGTVAIPLRAQSTPPIKLDRFEVGTAYEYFGYTACNGCDKPPQSLAGITGTAYATPNLALDATYLSGLEDYPGHDTSTHAGGRSSELLIGPRLTTRSSNVDFFVEYQAGYLHWTSAYQGISNITASGPSIVSGPETAFAMQAGFGAEISLPHRMRFRIHDAANSIHWGPEPLFPYPFPSAYTTPSHGWYDTLRMDLLVGVGPQRSYEMRTPDVHTHRFFDRTNLLLITASVGGQLADGYTTQVFLKQGSHEADALASPFVNHGWAGSIAAGAIVEAGEIAIMYGLHRKGHHRLERIPPVTIAASGGGNAYRNATRE